MLLPTTTTRPLGGAVPLEDPVARRLYVSVPIARAVNGAPPAPLALAQAAVHAIAALYREAGKDHTTVDWPTIQVNVSVGFRRACVVATADRGGRR